MISDDEIRKRIKQAIHYGKKSALEKGAVDPISIYGSALIFSLMQWFGFSGNYELMGEDKQAEFNAIMSNILNEFAKKVVDDVVEEVKKK